MQGAFKIFDENRMVHIITKAQKEAGHEEDDREKEEDESVLKELLQRHGGLKVEKGVQFHQELCQNCLKMR